MERRDRVFVTVVIFLATAYDKRVVTFTVVMADNWILRRMNNVLLQAPVVRIRQTQNQFGLGEQSKCVSMTTNHATQQGKKRKKKQKKKN